MNQLKNIEFRSRIRLISKMTKKLLLVIFIITSSHQLFSQIKEVSSIDHGILFSPRLDSDDDFKFKIKGFGFEGGYYLSKKIGKRGSISIDFRLAYSQSERNYMNLIKIEDSYTFFTDTISTLRATRIDYKNISLALPIKYRHQLFNKIPIFLVIGINPYFSLSSDIINNYDEIEFDNINQENISEIKGLREEINQKFYSLDFLLAGIGYKKNKMMFDIYFSGGNAKFDNEYLRGIDKLSIVFNIYYSLK